MTYLRTWTPDHCRLARGPRHRSHRRRTASTGRCSPSTTGRLDERHHRARGSSAPDSSTFFDRTPDAAGISIEQYEQSRIPTIVDSFAAGSEFATTDGAVDDDGLPRSHLSQRRSSNPTPRAVPTGWRAGGQANDSSGDDALLRAARRVRPRRTVSSFGVPAGHRLSPRRGRGPRTTRTVELAQPAPFASFGGVTLLAPRSPSNEIGYHESTNDAGRPLDALPDLPGLGHEQSESRRPPAAVPPTSPSTHSCPSRHLYLAPCSGRVAGLYSPLSGRFRGHRAETTTQAGR
ncbi:MAG: hypothetical protein R2710_10205 [Acidimicrobiales bacterium]